MLREVISEIVHDFLPLIFDFLPTEAPHERGTLVLDRFNAESVVAVDVGDLKLSNGLHWNWKLTV